MQVSFTYFDTVRLPEEHSDTEKYVYNRLKALSRIPRSNLTKDDFRNLIPYVKALFLILGISYARGNKGICNYGFIDLQSRPMFTALYSFLIDCKHATSQSIKSTKVLFGFVVAFYEQMGALYSDDNVRLSSFRSQILAAADFYLGNIRNMLANKEHDLEKATKYFISALSLRSRLGFSLLFMPVPGRGETLSDLKAMLSCSYYENREVFLRSVYTIGIGPVGSINSNNNVGSFLVSKDLNIAIMLFRRLTAPFRRVKLKKRDDTEESLYLEADSIKDEDIRFTLNRIISELFNYGKYLSITAEELIENKGVPKVFTLICIAMKAYAPNLLPTVIEKHFVSQPGNNSERLKNSIVSKPESFLQRLREAIDNERKKGPANSI